MLHTSNYNLSLHDALPIYESELIAPLTSFWPKSSRARWRCSRASDWLSSSAVASLARFSGDALAVVLFGSAAAVVGAGGVRRSEEHTSELESLAYLVCRLR